MPPHNATNHMIPQLKLDHDTFRKYNILLQEIENIYYLQLYKYVMNTIYCLKHQSALCCEFYPTTL